jgi:hypothetical protein
MILLFVLLGGIIGAYWYVTDSGRVKAMAENYLSGLLGGRVIVGKATLSIFEGLRLDDVRVYAGTPPKAKDAPDSSLFSAQAFLIAYNPQTLLSGKLEATEIKAIDPSVHLTEDLETGRWSFMGLRPRSRSSSMPSAGQGRPLVLPQIVLRNATVEYTQTRHGAVVATNSVSIEGQFSPTDEKDTYQFHLQSRGETQGVGPSVQGTLVMGVNHLKAQLRNFVIGPDVKAMLAEEVRKWVEDHQLAGGVDADVEYQPTDREHLFRVQMQLGGVTATVSPEEWMSDDQVRRLGYAQQALGVMGLAGLNTAVQGFVDDPMIDHLQRLITPTPVHLDSLSGGFLFTPSGIDITDVRGRVELNGFKAEGHIDGYRPSAAMHLHVTSPDNESNFVPAAPHYVTAMPAAVREVYDRFKPQGKCNFWVDIDRPTSGTTPSVAGELNIQDGQFCYEKFTYPVQHVSGKLIIGPDAQGQPSLRMEHIHGHGLDGGPNANADFEINGWMAPLGREVQIDIAITGKNIVAEPSLTAAYPSGAVKALRMFDAQGQGAFPRYRGDFLVKVTRDLGMVSHWTIGTDIHVTDGEGSLVAFPYPINGVTADVHIQGDHLQVIRSSMKRGNATLALDGNVDWGNAHGSAFIPAATQPDQPDFRPNLHIVAHDVPIDKDLLNALPQLQREWVQKLGIGGIVDVDGMITPPTPTDAPVHNPSPIDLDLRINWRDGTLAPFGGSLAATDLAGSLHLVSQTLELRDITGKRGDSPITAHGSINWSTDQPQINISATAANLQLDPELYAVLPDAAKRGWDAVHPVGTADVTVDYTGIAPSADAPAPNAPAPDNGYAISITPRNLSATVDQAPYRLDNLTGTVNISPDQVVLNDISGQHGGATVHISGTGTLNPTSPADTANTQPTAAPGPTWDLKLAAENMLVDDDLRRAVPAALANFLQSLELKGKLAFAFSKLLITAPPPTTQPLVAQAAPPPPADPFQAPLTPPPPPKPPTTPPENVDFALQVKADDASVNVGVPLTHVSALADMAGDTRNGRLDQLTGTVDASSLSLAQRTITDMQLELTKPSGQDVLQVQKIQGKIAGGAIAGQVEWSFPDKGPSRYAIGLVLQDADVREMSGDKNADIHGNLNASLAVEGNYNDINSRQGRGDVEVTGTDMYHIPLVLGLLQITNLALPITSPFSEATARYSIQGQRVTFEDIELRAKEMVMQGTGRLDFDTKHVAMTFTTDNTTWPKLPVIGDLINSARHELLQINVAGTLQAPKVSASSMNTFTTTIDQVLQGNAGDVTPDGKVHKGY